MIISQPPTEAAYKTVNRAAVIPPPCLLPPHILRPAGLLLPLFLPQDVVNAPADLLGLFHFLFQREIPPVERFPLGGQLGILSARVGAQARYPCAPTPFWLPSAPVRHTLSTKNAPAGWQERKLGNRI